LASVRTSHLGPACDFNRQVISDILGNHLSKSSHDVGASAPQSRKEPGHAVPSEADLLAPDAALARLVEQILVARVDGLQGPQVAAFVSGWSSALEVIRRTDLLLPSASPEVRRAIADMVAAIEHAQSIVLADPDDHPS
jgi:hypothetical protein